MSPQASLILIEEVVPRLQPSIPRCVRPVGCEDPEELVQDAIAVAAHLLHKAEQTHADITPGVIVQYTVLYMETGLRSTSGSQNDLMASVEARSRILSLEEQLLDPASNERVSLEELLANGAADCAAKSVRHPAWEQFLANHDEE